MSYSYRELGLGLCLGGAIAAPVSYFIINSMPLTIVGMSAIVIGFVCIALPNTRPYVSPEAIILKVRNLAEHQLRKTIREKPENEKQAQDAFESLLIGADIPYGREVDSIEYSSKTYTPDFSLPRISLAVEVKLCSRSEREKELPEEINDDILAYQTKYQNLLFVIYDLGFIRDKDRFSGSFEQHSNVTIRIIKH